MQLPAGHTHETDELRDEIIVGMNVDSAGKIPGKRNEPRYAASNATGIFTAVQFE